MHSLLVKRTTDVGCEDRFVSPCQTPPGIIVDSVGAKCCEMTSCLNKKSSLEAKSDRTIYHHRICLGECLLQILPAESGRETLNRLAQLWRVGE